MRHFSIEEYSCWSFSGFSTAAGAGPVGGLGVEAGGDDFVPGLALRPDFLALGIVLSLRGMRSDAEFIVAHALIAGTKLAQDCMRGSSGKLSSNILSEFSTIR
jgi:hypothetical protein